MPGPDDQDEDLFPWENLLDAIQQKEVIPVVGRDLSAWSDDALVRRTFDEMVAAELVTKLDRKFPGFRGTLEDRVGDRQSPLFTEEVALRFRLQHGSPTKAYTAFGEALKAAGQNGQRALPSPLQDLAQIEPLNFFLTVSFDDFLEQALLAARPDKSLKVTSSVRSGELPKPPENVDAQVHHLFGYKSSFELFDEARIRAVLDLEKKLESELADLGRRIRGRTLLFLGCGLPEWLMRFFVLALLGATTDENTRRPAQLADARVFEAPALAFFLESMDVEVYKGGDSHAFVRKLAEMWNGRNARNVPAPRAGAKVVLSCHEDDFALVEPEVARLRAWGVDADVVRSAQPLALVTRAIEASSFYVACLSAHCVGPDRQMRARLWPEWSFAKLRRETSARSFFAYFSAIADEGRVADEVGQEAHPLWGFSKRAGQDISLQLVEPLRKAGQIRLRGRAGVKGADEPLVIYCIYGKADWDGAESPSGVDDLIAYLEKTFRATPWLRLTHGRDLLGGADLTKAVDDVDALLLFASPAVDITTLEALHEQVEKAAEQTGQKIPLYRIPFRKMDPGGLLLEFKPLDLGGIEVVRQASDQAAQDRAWAAVARAIRISILDHYQRAPALPAR